MTQNEVAKIVGRSKEIINLGPRINIYTGDTLKMEMWHYGDKEAILFVNNKVDSVLDSKKMQELGERIMGQEYSIRKRN